MHPWQETSRSSERKYKMPDRMNKKQNIENLSASITGDRLAGRVRKLAFILMAMACLTPLLTPPVALACGAVFVLLFDNPFPDFSKKASKILLQVCVVLLGFQMDFQKLLRTGASGWIFAAVSISVTLGLGWLIGRALRLRPNASTLISAGTAICGGSAIAAVGPVISASEADMTVAMGTVFTLNAVALYAFPVIGHLLGLSQAQFGLWSGIAIHDVSSVVGAASTFGNEALQVATAVKLSRTLWIVPVTLAMAFACNSRYRVKADGPGTAPKIKIPWFIGLFVLASLARLLVPSVAKAAPVIGQVAKTGLTMTLMLVGSGLTQRILRAAGWKALLQGVLLWLFIGGVSLGVILYF